MNNDSDFAAAATVNEFWVEVRAYIGARRSRRIDVNESLPVSFFLFAASRRLVPESHVHWTIESQQPYVQYFRPQ